MAKKFEEELTEFELRRLYKGRAIRMVKFLGTFDSPHNVVATEALLLLDACLRLGVMPNKGRTAKRVMEALGKL